MNRALSFILLGLGCLVMAACSPTGPAAETPAAAAVPAYDFKAMLSRTDEVSACKKKLLQRYGDGCAARSSCAEAIVQSYCQCSSEVYRAEVQDLEASPALQNAIVQVTLNPEVVPELYEDNGDWALKEELDDYLLERGVQDLGFTKDEFYTQLRLVKETFKPEEADLEHYANKFPSCGTFVNKALEFAPEWKPSTGMRGYNALQAAERYDFKAMLSRTDEVEVCMNLFAESSVLTRGRLVKPTADNLRPTCQCLSDSARKFIHEAGATDPVVANAMLQLATNLEVLPIFKDTSNGGQDAFVAYLEASLEADFGVSAEKFSELFEATAPAVQQFNDNPFKFLDEFPSCRTAFIMGQAYYPEEELDPSMNGWEEEFPDIYEEVEKLRAQGPLRRTIN